MEYGEKLILPQNPSTKKPVKLSDYLCSIEGVQKTFLGAQTWKYTVDPSIQFGYGPKARFIATRQTENVKRLFELFPKGVKCHNINKIPEIYGMEYGEEFVLPQNPSTKKRIKLSDYLCSIEGVQKFGCGPMKRFGTTRQNHDVGMAIAAIKALADPKGSSILQIKQYIEANNMNSVDHNRVCGALEYGVAVGSLSRPEKKKGFYKLAPKNPPKKATPKKVRRIIDVYTRNQVGGRILVAK